MDAVGIEQTLSDRDVARSANYEFMVDRMTALEAVRNKTSFGVAQEGRETDFTWDCLADAWRMTTYKVGKQGLRGKAQRTDWVPHNLVLLSAAAAACAN